jgi:hypothetical protein
MVAVATDATDKAPQALPAGPSPPPSPARTRALAAGRLLVRLAFDLLVIDAAVESWLAGSPIRMGLAATAALYFVLTGYVVSKGGRVGGRGWLMDPFAGAILFLGFLVACSWAKEWTATGIAVLRHGAPVVLPGAMIALVVAAACRMLLPGGTTSWTIRVVTLLVCGYATASFARGIADAAPFHDLLTGRAFWLRLPWWGQGAWLGAFVVLPVAFLRELGASIARLAAVPYLRWMLIFGLGCWVAFNVASF